MPIPQQEDSGICPLDGYGKFSEDIVMCSDPGDCHTQTNTIGVEQIKGTPLSEKPPYWGNCIWTEWTVIFPGKGGLAWKRAWDGAGTKEEAEKEAVKHCNCIAVPLALLKHLEKIQYELVKMQEALDTIYIAADKERRARVR